MFAAKFFRKEHKLGSYKGKTIVEAKRPLLIFSLDIEFYLAFAFSMWKAKRHFLISPKGHLQAFKRVLENEVLCQLLCQTYCICNETIKNFIIDLIWSNTFKCPGVDRGSSSSIKICKIDTLFENSIHGHFHYF